MKKGDRVLFYHSSCDLVGVVGEATVKKEAYPDPTQFDKNSEGFDKASTLDNPRWSTVDMSFSKIYKDTVTLAQIKASPQLQKMTLIRPGNRLSVMPVTEREFVHIQTLAKE
jgi:predicted RNA-binding protein with PUA-like domain